MDSSKLLTDELGLPYYSSNNILEMIYRGQSNLLPLINANPNDYEVKLYNETAINEFIAPLSLYSKQDISIEEFDKLCQENWRMPEEYKKLDIKQFLLSQTIINSIEYFRVLEEFKEFENRNLINLLRWLKYFVDNCRQNKILWGVGRGSSVSSYILYLIGVHRINPIKYKLDWREFLK